MRIRAAACLILLAALAGAASAQNPAQGGGGGGRLVPKRTPLPEVILPACSIGKAPSFVPTSEERRHARDLVSRADQAAILGDTASALTSLRSARALDPADADVAYRLARLYESGAAADSAVKEYCRFLSLAPASSDAADARERVTALAKPVSDPVVDSANALFQQGLRAYDAGRMPEAEARFARAIDAQPAWADAYFDRAIVRAAEDDRDNAVIDYEVYIRLRPSATDRAFVVGQIAELRGGGPSAAQAFGLGLVIPGAGQFYTHRPGWGALYLVGTAAAVGFAMQQQTTIETTQQTATDPFGNPYTFTGPLQGKRRGHLAVGLAAAGAIDLAGAIEAAVYASRQSGVPASRVSLELAPARTAVALRVAF